MNLFNFFKSQELKKIPDSVIIKKARNRLRLDQYTEKYKITKDGVRNEFLENDYDFIEFSAGLTWILAVSLLDSLYDDEYIAARLNRISNDILLFDCVCFLSLCPLALYQNDFLEDDFESYYETMSRVDTEIVSLFHIDEKELNDIEQDRIETIFYKSEQAESYFKAICAQFSNVIRSREDIGDNDLSNTNVNEYHIANDSDRYLGLHIQEIVYKHFRTLVNTLKSAVFRG